MLTTSKHCFGLPKVVETKTPQLDSYIKTEVSVSKSINRKVARIQTYVFDRLMLLTSMIECDKQGGLVSHKEVLNAVKTAVRFIWKQCPNIPSPQEEGHLKFPQRTTTPCPESKTILKKLLLLCLDLTLLSITREEIRVLYQTHSEDIF